MAEIALACHRTFRFADFARRSYGLDFLSIYHSGVDNNTQSSPLPKTRYQQKYANMKL